MLLQDPDSLDVLKETPDIEDLSLRHFCKIHSLEPLRALTKLRVLFLLTIPSWDSGTRNLIVDSFEPLTALKKLERIKIIGVIPTHNRLAPLSRIPSLSDVQIASHSSFYQLEDFAALSAALPKARETLNPVRPFLVCSRCKTRRTLLLKGSKPRQKRSACPLCERGRLIAHLERWNNAGGFPRYDDLDLITPDELTDLFGAHYPIQGAATVS
jgi:hypothetical protein